MDSKSATSMAKQTRTFRTNTTLSNAYHLNCDRLLWFVVDLCTTKRQSFGFFILKRETHAAIESIKKNMQRNNSILVLFCIFVPRARARCFLECRKIASGLLCCADVNRMLVVAVRAKYMCSDGTKSVMLRQYTLQTHNNSKSRTQQNHRRNIYIPFIFYSLYSWFYAKQWMEKCAQHAFSLTQRILRWNAIKC